MHAGLWEQAVRAGRTALKGRTADETKATGQTSYQVAQGGPSRLWLPDMLLVADTRWCTHHIPCLEPASASVTCTFRLTALC